MPFRRVLIVGAGVAGSITAFWLAKSDFEVTVVERSRAEQKLGQGIEIERPALKVVQAMGIIDRLKAIQTAEKGFKLQDEQARTYATFGLGNMSPTGDLELMRGDFTEVLYKAADEFPNVTYRFETTVQSLRQTDDKVFVDLQDRRTKSTTTEEFDFVIGADGARSRTRELVLGTTEELNCLKPVGAYVAYFSVPKTDGDWPMSKMCHFTGRRVTWIRPAQTNSDAVSVYFVCVKEDIPALRQANASGDRQKQKQAFAELYKGAGWEMPRVLDGMMETDNFYSEELVQIKLQKWSKQRVVFVGDSAWAPTVFTGEGNQLAIMGAWVLAQELSRHRSPDAFETYESRLRAYVDNAQQIGLGGYAPYLTVPETRLGIWTFRAVLGMISWMVSFASLVGMTRLLPQNPNEKDAFDLQIEDAMAKKIQ